MLSTGEGLPVPEEARVSSTVEEAPEEEAASFLLRKAIRRLLSRLTAEGLFFFFTGTWAGEDLIPIVSREKQNVPNVRLNESEDNKENEDREDNRDIEDSEENDNSEDNDIEKTP